MSEQYFPDLFVASPSGAYRAEARSLNNATTVAEKPFSCPPFSRDFVYSVYQGDRLCWSYAQQPESEPSPNEIYVSNEGELVVETRGGLLAFDRFGKKLLQADLRPWFPDDLVGTTTGTWFSLPTTRFFACRHWICSAASGKLLGVNLENGQLTQAASAEIDRAERAHLLEGLERGVQLWVDGQRDRSRWRDIEGLVIVCCRRQLREAIPLLLRLEEVDLWQEEQGSSVLGLSGEQIYLRFRMHVQMALRGLGQRPRGLPTYQAYTSCNRVPPDYLPDQSKPWVFPQQLADLDRRLQRVVPGTTAQEIWLRVGSPNFIQEGYLESTHQRVEWWDYDLNEEDATLRCHFVRSGLNCPCQRLEWIRPGEWRKGPGSRLSGFPG